MKRIIAGLAAVSLCVTMSLHLVACDNDPYSEHNSGPDISDLTQPVFAIPIVEIPTTAENALRQASAQFHKIGFGVDLEWDTTKPDRPNVALEYYTRDAEADVRAPCDLYLEKIMDNEVGVGDMELELRTSSSSAYFIYIDHVRDLRFNEGDFITQGQVIGLSGVYPEYRSELQVNFLEKTHDNLYHTIHYCPLDFGTEDFIKSHSDFAPLEEWKTLDSIDGGYFG